MARIPGKFVWFELFTGDVDAAQRFYGETFGWKNSSMKMGDGSQYPMAHAGETQIGGYREPPEGAPVHWHAYLSVDDVDGALKRAKAAGGTTPMEAIDIPGVGRMAPVIDPQGAGFSVFKSEGDDPADAPTSAGHFHWNELWTSDASAAVKFYKDVFAYEASKMAMPDGDYHVLATGEAPRGGVMKSPNEKAPNMWLPYVHVDDADACAKRAKQNGGEIISEPQDTPTVGRHGIMKDPTGGVIGFMTPAPRDG